MARETLPLTLPEAPGLPLAVRIARALVEAVRAGRLGPGARLPGARTLAGTLGVHRNTVDAAYRQLSLEGWTVAVPGSGTRVSEALPEVRVAAPAGRAAAHQPGRRAPALRGAAPGAHRVRAAGDGREPGRQGADAAAPGRHQAGAAAPGRSQSPAVAVTRTPAHLWLMGGTPDLSLFPAAELSRALRRALAPRHRSLLDYGAAEGHPALREAARALLARRRGVVAERDQVLVVRGTQLGLHLVAQALLGPGDRVAVEALGYPPAWDALASSGATLVPLAVDAGGLDVDALEAALAAGPLRAVYLTPHHQYPSTVVLSQPRRARLLALAERHRFAVIEDDYDHEFHYEGRPVLPLASVDAAGSVIYLATLSKILAPGLRLGFVVAPAPIVARLAALRRAIDRQGDAVLEAAVAELLEDGTVERHARRMRRVYLARRDAFAAALRDALGARLAFSLPAGGMALWARTPGVDAERWRLAALERGVVCQSSQQLTFPARSPGATVASAAARRGDGALRLGFAAESEERLRLAARRLAECWPGKAGR